MWTGWHDRGELGSDRHWELLDRTYDDLAERVVQRLETFLDRDDRQEHYQMLSQGALDRARNDHDSRQTSFLFDRLYEEAIAS